jgi:hypothetical protein
MKDEASVNIALVLFKGAVDSQSYGWEQVPP